MRHWFGRLLIAFFAVLLVLAVTGYAVLRSSLPELEGNVAVKGISGPVEIVRDENAIPHIFAKSRTDGYFGLGYVHAQDRLWQLEMTRRVANGRLAEAIGEDGLPTDTLVAALDIEGIAARTEQRYSPEVQAAIGAYVAGINASIANHKGAWPPEFLLLGLKPQPWQFRDVSRAGALVTLGFGDWRDELLRARLLPRIGCPALRSLYASQADPGPVSYPQAASETASPADSCGALPFRESSDAIAALLPYGRSAPASNGWAVDGRKTGSGLPLLANDPHGPLTAPADYYLVRMTGPGFEIVGASRPGSPGFASGRNSNIAWGVTDMMIDQADIVIERLAEGQEKQAYLRGGQAVRFTERKVSIPVKGGPDRIVTIRATPDGPVLSDHDDDAALLVREQLPDGHVAVLRGMDFAEGLPLVEALVGMADANNFEAFRKAVGNFRFQQNFIFADRDGKIALLAAAHIPVRSGDGFLPVPGWQARFGGTGVLPDSALPADMSPASGYVMNANNRTMHGSGPFDSPSFEPGWRAIRISGALQSDRPLTVADMKELQLDIRSAEINALKPFLATIQPTSTQGRQALNLLKRWDGSMSVDRPEPLIWNAWVRQLAIDLLRPKLGDLTEVYLATQRPRLARLLSGEGGWCEVAHCAALAARSLDMTLAELAEEHGPMAQWRWGDVHRASFVHDIFSYLPLVGGHLVTAPATPGDAMSVNSGQTSLWGDKPFAQDYGPRYRQIIDLAAPDESLFMIAPGVSGHPLSPWFSHFVPDWAAGRYVKVSGGLSAVKKRGIGRLTLSPRPSPR